MAQCAAKTKDNKPCQIATREGQKYCHVHGRERILRTTSAIGVLLGLLGIIANITGVLGYIGIKSPLMLDAGSPAASPPAQNNTPTNTPGPTANAVPVARSHSLEWLFHKAVPWSFKLCGEESDWVMAGKNIESSSYACDFPVPSLPPAWEFQGSGELSMPIVVDDHIYLVEQNRALMALALHSGEVLWEKRIDDVWSREQSLAFYKGRLYLAAVSGVIYAIDAGDGNVLWSYDSQGKINSSPMVFDGKVFVGNETGKLVVLDWQDGRLLWSNTLGEIYGSNVIAGDKLAYVASREGTLYALDTASGKVVWQRGIGGISNGRTPTLNNGVVYVMGTSMYALDAQTGRTVWNQTIKGFFEVQALSVDEYLVYVSQPAENKMVALDKSSGEVRWETRLPGTPTSFGPVVSPLYLYLRAADRKSKADIVLIINKLSGEITGQFKLPDFTEWQSVQNIVVSNRSLLVTTNNHLYGFRSDPGNLLVFNDDGIGIWNPQLDKFENVVIDAKILDCKAVRDNPELFCIGLEDDHWKLYAVDKNSLTARELADFHFPLPDLNIWSLSPKSERLAVADGTGFGASGNIDHGRLFIFDRSNSTPIQITAEFCGAKNSLAWSPDGNWLAYAECIGQDPHPRDASMTIVNADGSIKYTLGVHGNWTNYAWSPDGLWISYEGDEGITLVTPDGKKKFVTAKDYGGDLAWSPSGQWISNEPSDADGTGIYIADPSGMHGQWVYRAEGYVQIGSIPHAWSLDGSYIAYLDFDNENRNRINVIEMPGGNAISELVLHDRYKENVNFLWIP